MGFLKQEGIGALYSLDAEKRIKTHLSNLTISNGICWSLDGKIMYHIDTPSRTVCSFAYNSENGTISDKKVCITIAEGQGFPDGCTIDNEGMIWIALFGGSSVVRYDPTTGVLLGKIKVPVEQCTSVAFGGLELDILYITTAQENFTPAQTKSQPTAGCLYQVNMSKTTIRGVTSGIYAKPQPA